jgi:hypothetical protein
VPLSFNPLSHIPSISFLLSLDDDDDDNDNDSNLIPEVGYAEFFLWFFLSPRNQMPGPYIKLRHECFLPYPF